MRERFAPPAADLNLTAMIDVIFLIMVYFLFAQHPLQAEAQLEAANAAPGRPPNSARVPTLFVQVARDGFRIEGRPATRAELDDRLRRAAELDAGQGVRIACDPATPHQALVDVLDACAAGGLRNVTVETAATR